MVLVALEGPKGLFAACTRTTVVAELAGAGACRDRSGIVPDFPLINKSFNLSYSGVDL